MSVTLIDEQTIRLAGDCSLEDAEGLVQALLQRPEAAIDWRDCERLHTAVIQVLLVAGRRVVGPPQGLFVRRFIAPLVDPAAEATWPLRRGVLKGMGSN